MYTENFKPSEYLSEPLVNVSLQVICAPTEEEAHFIGSSRSLNKVLSTLGLSTKGLLPPEEAVNWPLDGQSKAYLDQTTQSYIEGDPTQVKEGILLMTQKKKSGKKKTIILQMNSTTRNIQVVIRK